MGFKKERRDSGVGSDEEVHKDDNKPQYFMSLHLAGYNTGSKYISGTFQHPYRATSSFLLTRHVYGKGIGLMGTNDRRFWNWVRQQSNISRFIKDMEEAQAADEFPEVRSSSSGFIDIRSDDSGYAETEPDMNMVELKIANISIAKSTIELVLQKLEIQERLKQAKEIQKQKIQLQERLKQAKDAKKQEKHNLKNVNIEDIPIAKKPLPPYDINKQTTSQIVRRARWNREGDMVVHRDTGEIVILLNPFEYEKRMLKQAGLQRGLLSRSSYTTFPCRHQGDSW